MRVCIQPMIFLATRKRTHWIWEHFNITVYTPPTPGYWTLHQHPQTTGLIYFYCCHLRIFGPSRGLNRSGLITAKCVGFTAVAQVSKPAVSLISKLAERYTLERVGLTTACRFGNPRDNPECFRWKSAVRRTVADPGDLAVSARIMPRSNLGFVAAMLPPPFPPRSQQLWAPCPNRAFISVGS